MPPLDHDSRVAAIADSLRRHTTLAGLKTDCDLLAKLFAEPDLSRYDPQELSDIRRLLLTLLED